MKKLVLLIVFVLLSQLAEAKTILYVTNASTDTPCSALQATDSLYCSRLVNLGYKVSIIDELHARDNSTTWNQYADGADMIFLGSDSSDMANTNTSRNRFCGNITSKNKPMFFTSINTWISQPNTAGCAFYANLVNFSFSNNKCTTKTFKIAKSGFITEGFEPGENLTVYSTPRTAKIYDTSNGGWVTAECIPTNGSIDFYPVLFTNGNSVFWGLDESTGFSNETWGIFDRTVLNLMNDSTWYIEAFSLPKVSTVNQDIMVLANVTQNGLPISGAVNYSVANLTGSMTHGSLWRTNISFSSAGIYNLNLNAYSYSLRGLAVLPITVGNLVVNITSGDFGPSLNYVVIADIDGANSASYRILNSTTYETITSGSMFCENFTCTGTASSMPDTNSLLLEVTASGSSVGGALKVINRETLSTDKEVYSPGSVITVDFFPNETLDYANMTIIRPDGTKETSAPLQMDMISTNHWNKKYNLGQDCLNGTWVIDVKTKDKEYKKSVDVIAWKSFAYLNKNSYDAFDNLLLVFGTTGAYSNGLDINVSANITRPDNGMVPLGYAMTKGNGIYNFSYLIPKDYPNGLSSIKIIFNDSFNRSTSLNLNFSTNITVIGPSLSVTPSTMSITTIEGKTVEKPFTISNSADVGAPNIVTDVSGLDITVEGPSSLDAGGGGGGEISVNTAGLSEGAYVGRVDFHSVVGDASIIVSLNIIGDLYSQASEKYSQLSSIEDNITSLSKSWLNTTNASTLLNETRTSLNETMDAYNSENYELADAKFQEASSDFNDLETEVNNLRAQTPDYSYIVWYFALAVVVMILTIASIKVKTRKKKSKKEKKEAPKEEQPEEVYFEPKGGEYRTEYY